MATTNRSAGGRRHAPLQATIALALAALVAAAPAWAACDCTPWDGGGGTGKGVFGLPNGIPDAYGIARRAGFGWVRINLKWKEIEPVRGIRNWDLPTGWWCQFGACESARERIRLANAAGFAIMVTLSATPDWAQCYPDGSGCPAKFDEAHPPKDAAYFREFAAAAAREFGCVVKAWEMWNEPNYDTFWTGNAQQYRDLILRPGLEGIKSVKPDLRVGGGSTLNKSTDNGFVMDGWVIPELDFFTFHAYGGRAAILTWIDRANAWCAGKWFCTATWLSEYGFSTRDPLSIDSQPGDAILAVENRCRNTQWCWNSFVHNLSDRYYNNRPGNVPHDFGLFDVNGVARDRFCTVARGHGGALPPGC